MGISRQNLQNEDVSADEVRLHEEFLHLLQMMEDYLKPITQQLDVALRYPITTTISPSLEFLFQTSQLNISQQC